jgi:hypothetical protein
MVPTRLGPVVKRKQVKGNSIRIDQRSMAKANVCTKALKTLHFNAPSHEYYTLTQKNLKKRPPYKQNQKKTKKKERTYIYIGLVWPTGEQNRDSAPEA